jgi:hypothetical protein
MHDRTWNFGALCGLAIVATGCFGTVDKPIPVVAPPAAVFSKPDAAEQPASFAYADKSGSRLLSFNLLERPAEIHSAICEHGRIVTVQYKRRQARGSKDTGRQDWRNFDNDDGDAFQIVGERAGRDETCFLTLDAGLLADVIPSSPADSTSCPPSQTARLGEARGREITQCRRIAQAARNIEVLVAQFATVGKEALGALAVMRGSTILFDDHRGDTTNLRKHFLWRVDDEGKFHPEDFHVLFVADTKQGLMVATAWAGVEGEDYVLLKQIAGSTLHEEARGYRNWSPR